MTSKSEMEDDAKICYKDWTQLFKKGFLCFDFEKLQKKSCLAESKLTPPVEGKHKKCFPGQNPLVFLGSSTSPSSRSLAMVHEEDLEGGGVEQQPPGPEFETVPRTGAPTLIPTSGGTTFTVRRKHPSRCLRHKG